MANPEEPRLHLRFGKGENAQDFIATPENTSLWTFAGKLALIDHVLCETDVDDEGNVSAVVIRASDPIYKRAARFLTRNGYPLYLNLREPPKHVLDHKDYWIETDDDRLADIIDWTEASHEPPTTSRKKGRRPNKPEGVDEDVRTNNYLDLDGWHAKPLPGENEVPYRLFEYFMEQADRGEMTLEVALDHIRRILGENNNEEERPAA